MQKTAVLIVEDQALIRMESVEMVEEAGFAAVEANDADAAIGILEIRRDIRVVFADIKLPGSMDGLRLAHAIRGRWPPIHLILTSGLNLTNEETLPEPALFIAKPYSPEQVAAALWDLFANHPRSTGGVSRLYELWRRGTPQQA